NASTMPWSVIGTACLRRSRLTNAEPDDRGGQREGIRTVGISDCAVKGRPGPAAGPGAGVARGAGMTTILTKHLSDYLAMRRALGFKLERQGALMAQFVAYLDSVGATRITTDAVLAWATQPHEASAYWWSCRLRAARLSAKYMINIDPTTEVPPADL